MRKIAFLVIFFLFGLYLLFPVRAGEPTVRQAYGEQERAGQDYLFQYAEYTEAHKTYQTAKEAYQKFGTIVSQQEAIAKAKQVLALRAEVLRTYLQLLKVKLNAQQKLDPGLRNSQFGKIEATQAFLTTHKENVQKTKSLFEVNAESQRLEREAEPIEALAYESLAFILIGEVQGLEFHTRTLLDNTLREVSEQSQAIEQGASEAQRKLTNVRVAVDRATDTILSSETSKINKITRAYQEVQKEMTSVKTTLKEAALLVKEIERSISYE